MNRAKRIIVSAALLLAVGVGGLLSHRPWAAPQPLATAEIQPQALAELPVSALPSQPAALQGSQPALGSTSTPTVAEQAPADNTRPRDLSNRGEVDRQAINQDLNQWVLAAIGNYQGGSYPYLLNEDYAHYNGVTQNLIYKGQTIAKANPSGDRASNCVGITFEVFFRAMQARNRELGLSINDFNGMSANDLHNLLLMWFVAGPKESNNVAAAVERYGIGTRIRSLEDAKPGDFIDLSRTNSSGHTVVLINLIRENGKIIGFKYWSSQESTDGISYETEYFPPNGRVLPNSLYIARINAVSDYRSY